MSEAEHDVSWALKILEREPDYEQNLIAKHFHMITMGALGGGVPIVANLVFRRPLWAGIQKHIIGAIAGACVGYLFKIREEHVLSTRDAMLRDYITRHPEDFPPPVRSKYADTMDFWVPIR